MVIGMSSSELNKKVVQEMSNELLETIHPFLINLKKVMDKYEDFPAEQSQGINTLFLALGNTLTPNSVELFVGLAHDSICLKSTKVKDKFEYLQKHEEEKEKYKTNCQ